MLLRRVARPAGGWSGRSRGSSAAASPRSDRMRPPNGSARERGGRDRRLNRQLGHAIVASRDDSRSPPPTSTPVSRRCAPDPHPERQPAERRAPMSPPAATRPAARRPRPATAPTSSPMRASRPRCSSRHPGAAAASRACRATVADPEPPLVLLCHLDVVPVDAESWSHDPFGGRADRRRDLGSRGVRHEGHGGDGAVVMLALQALRRDAAAGRHLRGRRRRGGRRHRSAPCIGSASARTCSPMPPADRPRPP